MEKGVYTVLVTPFDSKNQIDFDSYDNLLNDISKSNIEGVVVLGTTSESPTLSPTGLYVDQKQPQCCKPIF